MAESSNDNDEGKEDQPATTDEVAETPATAPTPTPEVKIPYKFVNTPFPYHYLVDIQIESLSDMGWGQGPIVNPPEDFPKDVPANWQVRVPLVLEGEIARVKIFRNYDTYSDADLVAVLQESPDRVKPKCPLAGTCGGCQFQHMKIDKQRAWKTEYVRKGLIEQQIAGYTTTTTTSILDTILFPAKGTDEIYEYRSKITPHYQAPTKVAGGGDEEYELEHIGFQQFFSRQLVDVEECVIATPAINDTYKATRLSLQQQAKEGKLHNRKKQKKTRRNKGGVGATLLFRQADDDAEGNPVVVTDNKEYMTTTIKGLKFKYQAGNFFQNNNYVTPLMVDGVLEAAIAPTADGVVPTHLIDCYCGSGLFALSVSSKLELVVGIEVQEKAVQEATENAKANDITNCQFVAASAEAIFLSPPAIKVEGYEDVKVADFPRDKTVVVLDPPRKGCSGKFLEQLYAYGPQRVVYMSCGPATQARDAKGIVEIGGYDIVSIQPFDLFPQTKHIECLMVFEKKTKPKEVEVEAATVES
mmetsp:Transcript_21099/g.32223  ORF Transcript_21099/g.32223 Transcript_21099/m.32223 type:complete len:527 (-) Transcript_21099:62-1642(-)